MPTDSSCAADGPHLQEGHDFRCAPEQQHADHPRKVARRHTVQRPRLHTTALASCPDVSSSFHATSFGASP